MRCCFPSAPKISKEFFAFDFRLRYDEAKEGWEVYDPILEFIRQGVDFYLE